MEGFSVLQPMHARCHIRADARVRSQLNAFFKGRSCCWILLLNDRLISAWYIIHVATRCCRCWPTKLRTKLDSTQNQGDNAREALDEKFDSHFSICKYRLVLVSWLYNRISTAAMTSSSMLLTNSETRSSYSARSHLITAHQRREISPTIMWHCINTYNMGDRGAWTFGIGLTVSGPPQFYGI